MSEADKILLAELIKNPVEVNCYLPFVIIGLGKDLTREMQEANVKAIMKKQKEMEDRKELIDRLTKNITQDNATKGCSDNG